MENKGRQGNVKKQKRKNRKIERIKKIFLGIIIFAVLVAVSIAFFVNVFKVKSINFSVIHDESNGGNIVAWNTDEELKAYIFKDESDFNTILFFLKDKFGKKVQIPYVETYKVKINWPSDIVIDVYEKKIIGYVATTDGNMYFDKDGIVVEQSSEKLATIPKLSGVLVENISLHNEINMPSSKVLPSILEIKQQLDKYGLSVDEIEFDKNYNIIVKVDNIKLRFGECQYLTEKVHEYAQIAKELKGRKGTLYLEDCTGQVKNIYFRPE